MELDFPNLPPPGSTTMTEINFRRLLQSCHNQLQQDDNQRSQPKFHAYVAKLEELLSDVEASKTLDSTLLGAYKRSVKQLTDLLQPCNLPAFCQRPPIRDHLAGRNTPRAFHLTETLFTPVPEPPASQASSDAPAPSTGFSVSNATHQRLQLQEQLQEELTDELVSMSAALKQNVVGMQSAIQQREQVLQQADVALDDSLANAKRSAARAKQQYQRGRMSCCQTLLVVLLVAVTFCAMLVYIKGTYLLGYRASAERLLQRAGSYIAGKQEL